MAMENNNELMDLQQRFAAHEVDVPAGAWEAISGQLASTAGAEALRATLQDKFTGHEAHVDPGVWQNISSQLGHGVAAPGGISAGWLAAGVGALLVTGGILFWATGDAPVAVAPTPVPTEKAVPPPTTEPVAAIVPVTVPPAAHEEPVVVPAGHASTPSAKATTGAQRGSDVPEPVLPTTVPVTTKPAATPSDHAANEPVPSEQPANEPTGTTDQPPAQHPVTTAPATQPQPVKAEAATTPDPEPEQEPVNKPAVDPFAANKFFVPNVFTPNNDGRNDKLDVVVNGEPLAEVRLRIFSTQNGELVFSSNSLDQLWDGTINGARAPEGNYLFAIEGIGHDGRSYPFRTVVLLNR